MYGEIALLSGTANRPLAEAISRELKVPLIGADVFKFPNQNIFCRLHTSVRGKDVFVIQPTCATEHDDGSLASVNDNLMELLIMIDTLRRDSAGRITAVVPYYGYGRTDKKDQPRVPITARLVADLISAAGASRFLTLDLHAGQIQGFFSIPVDELTAFHILSEYFRAKEIPDAAVIAADIGATKRARNFAAALDIPLAIIEKRRVQRPDGSTAKALNVIGDVQGKNVIIFDDEIDTAGTVTQAIIFLKASGANQVYVCATHPIFSDPAVERLCSVDIDEIVVTDTVPLPPRKRLTNMAVLSVAPLLAEVIRRIHLGISVGALFNE
ncbi:MAG: ribose-phosphate pyrophosphokinase [Anaerolineales bacterium]|nr:MAG: ribose-phosphate pyrophosphokinase [Anaerolineales bacterium]